MLLFRRLFSSSAVSANKMKIIHLFPSDAIANKFGKYNYFSFPASITGFSSDSLYQALFYPPQGSSFYDAHKKAKEDIKEEISKLLKYAVKYVRNSVKDPMMVHISTPEFFFYPQLGGYSQEDITGFVEHIRDIVVNMPAGLHFNLGTFPFIVDRVPVPNTVFDKLYGNGRFKENIIESLSRLNFFNEIEDCDNKLGDFLTKVKPGEIFDFMEFSKLYLAGKFKRKILNEINNIKPFLSNIAICGESGKNGNVNIYSKMRHATYDPFSNSSTYLKTNDNRFFKSVTLSGDVFYKIYEICFNHNAGVAEKNEMLLKLRITPEKFLAFHEVISSSIELKEAYVVAETASHKDTNPDIDRIILSMGGRRESHKIQPKFKNENSHLFENSKWIKSSLFECEVSIGKLKPLSAPRPSDLKNANTIH